MSIVNEMLKDLENSEQKSQDLGQIKMPLTDTKSNTTWYYWGALLILIGVAFILGRSLVAPGSVDQKNSPLVRHSKKLKTPETAKTSQQNNQKRAEKNKPTPIAKQKSITKSIAAIATTLPRRPSSEKKNIAQAAKIAAKSAKKRVLVSNKTATNKSSEKILPKETVVIKKRSKKNEGYRQLKSLMAQWNSLDQQQAKQALDSFLKNYGQFISLRYRLLNFLQLRNTQMFKQNLSRTLQEFPTNPVLILLQARLYYAQNSFQAALLEVKKTHPEQWQAADYFFIGLVYQKNKHHREAINYFTRSLSTTSQYGAINMAMAISYQAINDHQQALNEFVIALTDHRLTPLQKQFVEQQIAAYQD